MLNEFCSSVQGRMQRLGFDWSQLVITLLPVVIEMISTCFNKSSDLQAFAEGTRRPLQLAGLRRRCKEVVQEMGVRGVFHVAAAAGDLQRAILDELDDQVGRAAGSGDVYQQAIDEAMSV